MKKLEIALADPTAEDSKALLIEVFRVYTYGEVTFAQMARVAEVHPNVIKSAVRAGNRILIMAGKM